ncbi:type II toxin-antitoxin system RelE/ParE family toxin [Herbaspirillum sp.]|uniref:type II toxin-antitoxin system RelE/ParE family toxin n=1 Tax=Herbaspirillum sp. TaxID=1890675 RepID=UPI0031D3D1D3
MSKFLSRSTEDDDVRRIFKTRWFAREARRFGIADGELQMAINQLLKGQADDLGGGVWKKRLSQNADRAIVLACSGGHFFFVFLFAKSDMANIRRNELQAFRSLADQYAKFDEHCLSRLVRQGTLVEVKHD